MLDARLYIYYKEHMSKNYFPHDSDARNDMKIKLLLSHFGHEGYGKWWILIEILREMEGFALPIDSKFMQVVERELDMKRGKLMDFINFLVEIKLLELSDGKILSKSLIVRMNNWSFLTKTRKERAIKAANSRWKNENDSSVREGFR